MKKPLFSFLASLALLGASHCMQAQTGAALNFDGADDYVAIPRAISNDFTIEFWVRTTQTAGNGNWYNGAGLVDGEVGGATEDFGTALVGNNFAFGIGNPDITIFSTTAINDGVWHHVAATRQMSTGKIKLYVDGNVQDSATAGNTNALTAPPGLTIGSLQTQVNYFNGDIDGVRLWSTVRSQALIQMNMNCNVTDTAAGLVAMYSFNEGTAGGNNGLRTVLHDVTGNGNSGTLNNFALTGTSSNYTTDARSNYLGLQSSVGSLSNADRLNNGVAADFDNDGDNDMLVTDDNGAARIYKNDGKGNFSNTYVSGIIPTSGWPRYATGDLNGDGVVDFVVTDGSTNVTAYVNDGTGNFTSTGTNLHNGTGTSSVAKVVDMNGDGKMDVIVGNDGNGVTDQTEVWLNIGTGTATFTFSAGLDNNSSKSSITTGDVDGDGDEDFITGSYSNGAELFLNNNNNGTFTQGTIPSVYSNQVWLYDWDQDGDVDYVTYDSYNNAGLRVYNNDGTGSFATPGTTLLQSSASPMLAFSDLNGDGFPDAVLSHWGGNAYVYLGDGCHFNLQTGCNYTLDYADNFVALTDFNGDGSVDIFCGARNHMSTAWMNYLNPVTATPLPVVSISGNTTVNYGSSTVLTASGASTYAWSANAGSALTASVSVSPTVATVYTVVGTNTVGCSSSATILLSINGAALDFDGGNDIVKASNAINSTLSASNKLTVEAWVNPSDVNYLGCIVGNYTTNGANLQFLLRRDGSNYTFWISDGTTYYNVTSTSTVTTNAWTHLAGTWDGTMMNFYVNGVLDGSTPASATNLASSTNEVWMGGNNAGIPEMFNGAIDEVRIWNRTLCQAEIQNNMNGELALPQTGLLSYYQFNSGVASGNNAGVNTLADVTGNGNTGNLVNFALTGSTSNWIAPGGVMSGVNAGIYTAPTLTVSGTNTICNGQSTVLTASGADTYTWTAGPSTASYTVSPTNNATYSVSGTSNGCATSMNVATVTVNPLPTVNATATSMTLCLTDDDTLNASGATTYTWSSNAGSVTTASSVITPMATGTDTYTVTGTDANSCVNMATVSVTVINCSTGINQSDKNNWVIYPNPSNGNFTLNAGSEIGSIEVYNALGILVYKTTTKDASIQIDLSREAAGMYYLNAQGRKMIISKL